MKEKINIEDIFKIYDNEISKTTKNKKKIIQFEKNKMQNVNYLIKKIKNEEYYIKHYNIFMISEPKFRIIMSLPIKDKVINHFITRNILEPELTKYLDPRNIATRKNMGTDYGIKKIKQYLEQHKKYEKFYILKMDIKKYFYSVDHEILRNLLVDKLDSFSFRLISNIIESTNLEMINSTIAKQKELFVRKYPNRVKEVDAVPFYEEGKGLPIGNMTSQFLSIFYLYKLDHYIVHNLKIPHFIRYMDDFILIHHDKEHLKYARSEIIRILNEEYKLQVNEKKTKIVSEKEGFSFLGYVFKVINKKTVMRINRSTTTKVIKSIKRKRYEFDRGLITYEQAFCSISTFQFSFKYANHMRIVNAINKYWFP